MFITAHTVFITWDAAHLLFHAVRLCWAVFVAAILKTDNKSSSLYLQLTLSLSETHTHTHTHTHIYCSLTAKKKVSFYSGMAVNWKAERVQRVEITHGDSEAHSLTCKSLQCRTGNAWGYLLEADKKLNSPFKQKLPGKNSRTRSATHWEESSLYCGQRSFRPLSCDLHRTHFLQPSSQAMQSS